MILKAKDFMLKQTKNLNFAKKNGKSSGHLKEWNNLCSLLRDKLIALLSGSEEDFLHIGSHLQDYADRARELSEMSASAAKLTSSEEITTSIGGLRGQLGKMSHYLKPGEVDSNSSMEKLQNTLNIIKWLDGICGDFDRTTSILRLLSVSIKIEDARLDNHNNGMEFNSVSADVKDLASLIDTKSGNILNNSKTLEITVRNNISRTQDLSKLQQSTTVNMLNDAQTSLKSLMNLNEKSSEASTRIAARSSEIYRNIGDVVTSLQCHDIARQQMEHVRDILKDMQERIEKANNKDIFENQDMNLIGWINKTCEIQRSQLLNTKNDIENAVNSVIENLRGISGNVNEMFGDINILTGDTHQSEATLLSRVEKGISAVINSIIENEKIENEISSSVSGAVNGIIDFVKEIESISANIKLLALNAQVQAEHVGEEGKALGVLAGAIQTLSVDTRHNTSVFLEKLKLKSITNGPKAPETSNNSLLENRETESGSMVKSLKNMLSSINRINTESKILIGRIIENGRPLKNEIEVFTNEIVFHEEMLQTISDISAGFSEIIDHIQKLYPDSRTYETSVGFGALENYYTVESERNVLNLITAEDASLETGATNKSEKKNQDKDLGDNIELF